MEKKKLLLVAVSVGVFLAVAISASILIFTPGYSLAAASGRPAAANPVQPAVTSPELPAWNSGQPATVDAADMVRKAEELQGIQTPPQAQAVQENYFYINGEAPSDSYQTEKTGDNAAARVVINVPRPSTAAVPDTPMEKPAPAAKPAALKTPIPAAKPVTAPKPASKPAAAPAPQTYTSYWVQTGAFSGKDRAEGAQETLSSKGISSIIDDRNMEGKTFYRVRVGPYLSENEAKYWLSLVKTIDGFSESQIRTTKTVK
jgi:DedD protein